MTYVRFVATASPDIQGETQNEEELRRELARPTVRRTITADDPRITAGGLNDVGGISTGRIIDTRGAIDLLEQAIGRLESL